MDIPFSVSRRLSIQFGNNTFVLLLGFLQENNAVAVLDIATATITDIYGLGFKDWGNLTMDPSDRDNGKP